jgi:hypothetical protein
MLAFTGLNVVVTVILAITRKRSGLFGLRPERKEGNEFMQAKTGQCEPTANGAPAHDPDEKQPPGVAAICTAGDNANAPLGK